MSKFRRRLLVWGWIAITCQSANPAGSPYRLLKGRGVSYVSQISNGKQSVTPLPGRTGVYISIASQTDLPNSAGDSLPGSVTLRSDQPPKGVPREERYLGPIGTTFELLPGESQLFVEYPARQITFSMSLSLERRTVKIGEASYWAGCGDSLSSLSSEFLQDWKASLPKEIPIPANRMLEIRIPHPSQKADPAGKQEYMSSGCPSIAGSKKYYDLTIVSTPPGARVFINGKYLAGQKFKVSSNPIRVLLRRSGCPDVAQSIRLEEGPNDVNMTFGGCSR